MVSSKELTVDAYVASLEPERQTAVAALRATILQHLPKGFQEGMGYGMAGYVVPHSLYPAGYHCDPKQPLPFLGFASQKGSVNLYHMGIYADPKLLKWFQDEYAARVKGKLDMGKSCIRFKKVDQIPLDLIGELVSKMTPKQWIELYEKNVKE